MELSNSGFYTFIRINMHSLGSNNDVRRVAQRKGPAKPAKITQLPICNDIKRCTKKAWKSMKSILKKPPSLSGFRPKSTHTNPLKRKSRNGKDKRKETWPDDEEESLFCESLMALMRRCERFDWLAPSDPPQKRRHV